MAKKVIDVKVTDNKEVTKWEDLVPISEELTSGLAYHQGLISSFIKQLDPILKDDAKLRETLVGGLVNLTKLTEIVIKNKQSHYETKEIKNEETGEVQTVIDTDKPRTGEIDPESDEYFDYIDILNNYATASSHLGSLSSQYGSEILTVLQVNKQTQEAVKDIDKEKFEDAKTVFDSMEKLKDGTIGEKENKQEGESNGKK